jgi:archaellum component FlaF (FlaF/FlaG flagellin family)
MGFSSIIATGIMVIFLLVTGYLIMATLDNAVSQATASQATARDVKEAQLHTSLAISNPGSVGDYMDFNVTNNGETNIDDITRMDVIVKSIAWGSVTNCLWLPYNDSSATGTDHWYVLYQVKNAPGSATSLGAEDVMRVRCLFGHTTVPARGEIAVAAPGGTVATLLYNIPVS